MTRNVPASIHQRLLNRAKAESRPFNELLQYFALERFLYRLGRSAHRQRFVLKGALMFTVWHSPFSRPTHDIDLLGRLDNSVESVLAAIREIGAEPAPDDGLHFDAESATGETILEAGRYQGVRVRFAAYLGTVRIPVQIDVGFGDPLVPGPTLVQLPTVLDLPAPEMLGYSRESAIAEKLHAMVHRGAINSRMKDFYDIWLLASRFDFQGTTLADAIASTFQQRRTAIPEAPIAFGAKFSGDLDKQAQWTAFLRRTRIQDAPRTLGETIQVIAAFLGPVLEALSQERIFNSQWPAGGPWRSQQDGQGRPSED
ncbi:MAG: nucleotidyl transferase AbiEii/AbiGii toxin family protein [Chloroflexi bacterium]|nr:nucleotidyl transferase AbiEii/AbiGii toxin family protein [Chloroflexota bacterium]